ncbi:ESYT1 protein, partial [Smithornis capensis]|nr:ESYT1 protein [Smithornis capensis]
SIPGVHPSLWFWQLLAQAWPFFGQYMEKLLVENVAPSIRASNTHLQTFTFTKVDMGEKVGLGCPHSPHGPPPPALPLTTAPTPQPLRVLGVRAHPGTHKKQILLDLNISYVGDVQIDVEVKKFFCKAGVKGMQLHGMLRIILEPLLGDVPIVGALTMFFIRRPTLDINWTGMTNLLDIPGLSSMSDTMIMDTISSYLVLPNRLLVPLVPDLHEAAQLRCPLPRGVVRVHLWGARDLRSKDRFMGGLVEGKSDPYAVLRVGTQVATSRVIDDNLNPTWDEVYEFIVHEVPGQEVEVELFDKDPDQDDLLGRMMEEVGAGGPGACADPASPQWFPLQEGGQGRLHLRLEWLSLMSDASKLDQVLERNQTIVAKPDPPSAAILVVYLDRAEELPVSGGPGAARAARPLPWGASEICGLPQPPVLAQMKKPGKAPNPVVQLSVQDITQESKVVCSTSAPVWEDAFRFFLHDPRNEDVDIQVKDDPRQTTLGSLSLPLSRLLKAPEMTLDEPFPLQHSGPGSRLHMKLVLRVLFPDTPEDGVSAPTPPGQPEPLVSTDRPTRPTQTTPDPRFGTEHVLRIHLLEAENLIAKDNFFKGVVRGRSDPYAKVRVAGRVFRSRVIKEDLNPRWNEVYEVIVDNIPGQDVEFDLFDKDVDKDDFLGRWVQGVEGGIWGGGRGSWLPLEEVKSGRLHVRLENLDPQPSTALLEQVLHTNSLLQPARGEELSAALLSVFVDRAADLPLRKSSKAPAAFASLAVRDVSFKTKVGHGGEGAGRGFVGDQRRSHPILSPQTYTPSTDPMWDEGFSFLIKQPHVELLELQVKEEGGQPLGKLSLPLCQLLASEGLALDGWFPLAGGSPGTQILLRAQLGVSGVLGGLGGEVRHPPSPPHSLPRSWFTNPQPSLAVSPRSHEGGSLGALTPHSCRPPEPAEGPRVQLTLWYHGDERKLVAIVHACRELRAAAKELPDPYVSLVLLPDRSRGTKRKTSVQRKTLNPDFNERFEWDLSPEEASRRKLEAHVKSTLSFMTREKEALGKV